MTNRDPGSATAGVLAPGAGAPSGGAGAAVDTGVDVDGSTSVRGAGNVVLEVGGDATDDDRDHRAGDERGEADVVATRRPSRPAAPCVPPPHAVARIAAVTAMSASARVLLVMLATSEAGYRPDRAESTP